MNNGLIDFNSQSRISFTLKYTGIIFSFIAVAYILIKLAKYLNFEIIRQRLLTSKGLLFTKFDRYLNIAAILFVIFFLSRIPSVKDDSIGLTGFFYFSILITLLIFTVIPWERRMSQRQNVAPFFILVTVTLLLIKPVIVIIKSL